MIEANKVQAKFLEKTLKQWEQENLLSEEQVEQLRNSILVQTFDWKKLAQAAFVIAILCVLGAVLSVIADNLLIELIGTEWGAVILSSLIATGFFTWGDKKKSHPLEKKFSSEALLAIGGIFVGVAVGFFGNTINLGSDHFTLLFFIAAVIYGILAIYYHSITLWCLLLASSTIWFGTGLAYIVDNQPSILGLNYFIWYLGWGGLLIGLSKGLEKDSQFSIFASFTYATGLFVLFFNLWLLSFDSLSSGENRAWISWVWTLILILASFAALVWGIKKEDLVLKVLGLSFLLINIYAKYFQFFWEQLHSTIFFAILALSFWFIGSRAEDIWSGRFWKTSDDLLDH